MGHLLGYVVSRAGKKKQGQKKGYQKTPFFFDFFSRAGKKKKGKKRANKKKRPFFFFKKRAHQFILRNVENVLEHKIIQLVGLAGDLYLPPVTTQPHPP